MKKTRKFKWIRFFFITFYVLILLLYISLILGKYIFNDSRSDFNFFGKSFYVLKTNDAALVNYDLKPNTGDSVVVKANNNVNIAKLNFEINKKTFFVKANINGTEEEMVVPANQTFLMEDTIPALGGIYLFISSIWGCLIIVILPCSLILIFEIVKIVDLSKSKKTLKKSDLGVKDDSSIDDEKLEDKDFNNKLDEVDKNNLEEQTDTIKDNSNKVIEKKSMDDILKNIEYKVNFQDTHKLNRTYDKISKITSKNNNSEFNLSKEYELKTKNIENGIEFVANPVHIDNLKLVLKTDGSLTITTDKYIANIELNI